MKKAEKIATSSLLFYHIIKVVANKKRKLVNIVCFIRTITTKKALMQYITE